MVPGLPPDISIRAWPDHCTMEYLKGRDGHLFHELNKHFLWTFWAFLTRMRVFETYILPNFHRRILEKASGEHAGNSVHFNSYSALATGVRVSDSVRHPVSL